MEIASRKTEMNILIVTFMQMNIVSGSQDSSSLLYEDSLQDSMHFDPKHEGNKAPPERRLRPRKQRGRAQSFPGQAVGVRIACGAAQADASATAPSKGALWLWFCQVYGPS